MIINQKKLAQVILSKHRTDGPEMSAPMKQEEDLGETSALHAICQDIILAIEHKSASELATAFQAAFQACDQSEDEGTSEPSDTE